MLQKLVMFMTAIAALTLVPVALDYVEFEGSGRVCPDALNAAEFCLISVFDYHAYTLSFDSEAFEAQDTTALLTGMFAASAAILAVSFTLNQIVLSNISQRYSSRLVDSYAGKPSKIFAAFVLMVAGSAGLLLVHSSLPAWLAACAVLTLVAGLFAALVYFARGFMHMVLVISPHNFIEDARKKILVSQSGSTAVQTLNEEQSLGMIQSLGDMAVKSLATSDDDVCRECIEALDKVGESSLSRIKSDSEDAIANGPSGDEPYSTYAVSVAKEFVRIIKDTAGKENTPITRDVLKKLYKMTASAVQNKNAVVIGALCDTDNLKGSPYLQVVERLTNVGSKYDKIYMMRHLADLLSDMVKGGYMPFAEHFATYHVFRSVKTIIDGGDFEMFKEAIHLFSHHPLFGNMEDMRELVKAEVSRRCAGMRDLTAQYDKIIFELDHGTKNDFSKILDIKDEVRRMLAQARTSADADQGRVDQDLYEYMDRLYVYSLLWGTFFRIACYIIGKGDEYAAYLHELWYHTNPHRRAHRSINTPPYAKDVDWNATYPAWLGQSSFGQIGDLDDENTYEPHYYEYAALHMLREDKIWHVPTDDEITEWGKVGKEYALEHHYEIASQINIGQFLKAADSLSPELLARMLPGVDALSRVESVKNKMKSFEKIRRDTILSLAIRMSIDERKRREFKERAHGVYSEHTLSDAVARIKYDSQLRDIVSVKVQDRIPRESLVKGNMSINEIFVRRIADAEFEKILEIAGNGAIHVQADAGKLKDAIKACVEQMRDGGHNPRVAFVPIHHRERMPETYATGTIDVADPPIPIIKSPWDRPPKETWILDPDCIEITYGAENEAGRMRLDIQDDKAETMAVIFSIRMSVRVLDGGGIARIASDKT